MATEVGTAYVSVIPSTRGFGAALNRQVTSPVQKTGVATGKRFGSAFGIGFKGLAAGALAAGGLAVFVKKAAGVEAEFSQTMNTLAAVANVPQAQLKTLSDLALKMGADTVFSASEAANAMLELSKGGISTAQIQAGALQETLTLAAASGTDMANAATILSNAMNTFGLSAKDAPKVTAALAGGANASTASIDSLGMALQQVGPGAVNAGLSIQETVAALAAFDNNGIKGSDAGTSLKTMLARLVPQTKKASDAMRGLGLDFTDSEGNFVGLTEMSRQLQESIKGLSEARVTGEFQNIFGSDAVRAATALAKEGPAGIRKFIKATQDQAAAQRIAQARMQGTAGAVEQLKGSFETAQLAIGQALAPVIQGGAGLITRALNNLATSVPAFMTRIRDPFGTFQTEIMPRLRAFGGYVKNDLGPALIAFGQVVGPALRDAIVSIAKSIGSLVGAFTSGDGSAKGFGQTLVSVLPIAAQTVAATFKLLAVNVRILTTTFRVLTANIRFFAQIGAAVVRTFAGAILSAFGIVINAAAKAFGWIPGIGPKLKTAAAKFAVFKTQVAAALTGFDALGFRVGAGFAANLAAGIAGRGKVTQSAALGTANKLAAGLRRGALIDGTRAADVRRPAGGGNQINVTVNNPLPERTSESVSKALRRKAHLAGAL